MSLDAFTAAATELLRREGVEGLTLRRIAKELDTGPASLYAYVDTLQDLHELVVDRLLGSVDLHPELASRPRERLEAVLGSYYELLLGRAGLAQLAAGTLPRGENAIRLTETVVGCLLDAGAPRGAAAWGYDVLMLHITGSAAETDRWRQQSDPVSRAREAYDEAADSGKHPHVAQVRRELFSGDGPSRLAWAMEVLLTGIEHAPDPPA